MERQMVSETLQFSNNFIFLLVGVMIVSGVLGGFANYFISKQEEKRALLANIIIGIVASLTVPLFLNMISSNLLELAYKNMSYILVFIGFCLVASVFSRRFLENLYSKLVENVKQIEREIESVKTEPDIVDEIKSKLIIDKGTISKEELKILKSMSEGKYIYRSLAGLSKDTGLSKENVNSYLSSLISKGLVQQKMNDANKLRWYLSPSGRHILGEMSGS